MIKIFGGGENITYTTGDTFSLDITSTEGFEPGTTLEFRVAQNEQTESLIDKTFELNGDAFEISLSDEESCKLTIGNYIYKITVIDAGGYISTRKSGEFTVKWGA